jgi:hypothetical protein
MSSGCERRLDPACPFSTEDEYAQPVDSGRVYTDSGQLNRHQLSFNSKLAAFAVIVRRVRSQLFPTMTSLIWITGERSVYFGMSAMISWAFGPKPA